MPEPLRPAPGHPPLRPYRYESLLFALLGFAAVLFWLLLSLITFGAVWLYVLVISLMLLAARSGLIAWLKGTGIRIGPTQFPDLHARIIACCQRTGITPPPEAYLITRQGTLLSFAARFLQRDYLVLHTDLLDAFESKPAGLNFYIGHQLGHLARKHFFYSGWIAPVTLIPLLGSAYRRARLYTCDQYGRACCPNPETACRALAVIAAGPRYWSQINLEAFAEQCAQTHGFWMSFNELTAQHPWLCKRMARLQNPEIELPRRHLMAWLLAACIPSMRMGGIIPALLLLGVMTAFLSALALPKYRSYIEQSDYHAAFAYASALSISLAPYYDGERHDPLPTPEQIGADKKPAIVEAATFNPRNRTLTLYLTNQHEITYLRDDINKDGIRDTWVCLTSIPAPQIPEPFRCESIRNP